MFSGTFDIWHWLIVLVIVVAIFGTKKLRNAGGDLGAAVRSFKKSMKEGEDEAAAKHDAEALAAEVRADPTANNGAGIGAAKAQATNNHGSGESHPN